MPDLTDAADKVPTVDEALDALHEEEAQATDPPVETPAETEPVKEPEQEPEAEPATAEADELAVLADEAKSHYGLTDQEIEQAGDLLPWVLARMDRQASLLMQGTPAEQAQQPAPPVEPVKPEPKREPVAELEKFELPINRDEYEEGTLKIFDALQEQINKQISARKDDHEVMRMMAQVLADTHKATTEIKSRTESVSASEYADTLDEFFSSLPDEYADIYGKEPMSQLSGNSPKAAARQALEREMKILADFDTKAGRRVRGLKEQASRTLRALHADKAHVVARREVNKQLTKRRQQGIARPTGRSTKTVDRRANALAAIEQHMGKLGL